MAKQNTLNKVQCGFLKGVPAYEREAMKERLCAGGEVVVLKQDEVAEAPPWAIVVSNSDYWIGCEKTAEAAVEKAIRLGFQVRQVKS